MKEKLSKQENKIFIILSSIIPGIVYYLKIFIWRHPDYEDNWSFESIPADISDGTVMATIRNLQISVFDKLSGY